MIRTCTGKVTDGSRRPCRRECTLRACCYDSGLVIACGFILSSADRIYSNHRPYSLIILACGLVSSVNPTGSVLQNLHCHQFLQTITIISTPSNGHHNWIFREQPKFYAQAYLSESGEHHAQESPCIYPASSPNSKYHTCLAVTMQSNSDKYLQHQIEDMHVNIRSTVRIAARTGRHLTRAGVMHTGDKCDGNILLDLLGTN